MHKHRHQADGQLRPSDNWKKGIPIYAYKESMWRHFMDVWAIIDGHPEASGQATDQGPQELMEALCGLYFNVGGLIHEMSRANR